MAANRLALVGNPNCGKTALFNLLTGARQKVANYAGATVERKEGTFSTPGGRACRVLDLPGTYGLASFSEDERVTLRVLEGDYPGEDRPDLLMCVVDATNLRLHLRLVLEVQRFGIPIVLVLNMADAARKRGIVIDTHKLSQALGVPVVETIAVQRDGADALLHALDQPNLQRAIDPTHSPSDFHGRVRQIIATCVQTPQLTDARVDAVDRWIIHPVVGPLVLLVIMFLIFQGVYVIGKPITDAIADGVDGLATLVAGVVPGGPMQGLVCDGLIGGLGTVLGFMPQILVLFFFIFVLEESGYLPRAAFILDRVMRAVGLSGRSFIPLLSSFACAIPGIIGARSISDRYDRLTTILVAPLMTCSARLPVYALLISAVIPDTPFAGIFKLQGIVLLALYLLGIVGAMAVGWVCKRLRPTTIEQPLLLMEFPAYRLPRVRDLTLRLWERGQLFLKKLTGVILALTVIMWFISTFPNLPVGASGAAIDYSVAGYLGQVLQPLFAPLGFNWQITLALIPAFAARETAVATLATVYSVANADDVYSLSQVLSSQISLATALSLMVWFAFAPQCMSTLAVIRKETANWRQVGLAFGYMLAVAYVMAWLTYRIVVAAS
ncbi:ferrous iron transporter B [Pseudomonas putida]|jgi:ferrous iron transport protein B|uniref:ferrous iron transporter B n=1 Tax=Pseudomonas putida TaxID=303 RepID=UPI0023637B20|nr:ferrous iron transporter B [Pseudomonas putida]MDD2008317.1 ferrous iron transporter B [Pseudomonas putida]